MTRFVAIEAGSDLPQLMERVARGESITITQQGLPVARLIPAGPEGGRDVEATVRELLEFRKAHPIDRESLLALIEEGRKH